MNRVEIQSHRRNILAWYGVLKLATHVNWEYIKKKKFSKHCLEESQEMHHKSSSHYNQMLLHTDIMLIKTNKRMTEQIKIQTYSAFWGGISSSE